MQWKVLAGSPQAVEGAGMESPSSGRCLARSPHAVEGAGMESPSSVRCWHGVPKQWKVLTGTPQAQWKVLAGSPQAV